jgi:5-methylcytosine-specific restriction endonuclease McrBC regulatory subunit McrC
MQSFREGLQAIEWTIEDRGLAGISDLEGIPWRMPMEQFFEAWLEVVFHNVAREIGAQVRTGRKRETVHAMHWEPSYVGAQNSLIPDLWLDCGATTVIVDAKYKRHWEELEDANPRSLDEAIRERHRHDIFQVLAYANLARTARVVVCLAYPCTPHTWARMCERKRVVHKADISVGTRSVALWLTAVPMDTSVENISRVLVPELRAAAT